MSSHMPDTSIEDLETYYRNQGKESVPLINFDGCKQIILIRHGEPDLQVKKWSNRKEALEYALNYDSVGVLPLGGKTISFDNLSLQHVFSSPTPRALHTAQLLFDNQIKIITDSRFREFERKIFWFPDTNIYLPLKFWITFSRILWILGFNSRDIESSVLISEMAY